MINTAANFLLVVLCHILRIKLFLKILRQR